MLTGYSEGIRKEEKEENGQKVNVNLVYCFLRSVGAQASKLGVPFTVYSLFILLKVYEIFSDFLLGEQSLNFGLLRKEIYQKSIQNLTVCSFIRVPQNRRSKQEQNQACLSFALQGGGRRKSKRRNTQKDIL